MLRTLLLVLVLVLVMSCKKETSPSGMPPPTDWKGGGSAPADPSAGMGGGSSDPHAGMGGGSNPHGGGGPHAGGGGPHAGGGTDGTMPTKTPSRTLEKLADGRSVLGPFTLMVPKEWTEKPVTSSMRAAQFDLVANDAELVVFYFGEGGAGGVEANLERWLGQFAQADGKASKDVAKIEKTKFAGQEATLVTVTGRYTTQQMPGGPAAIDKAEQMLLGAIVASPSGPYYFKLVGSKKTVEAQTAKVKAMLASMKLK